MFSAKTLWTSMPVPVREALMLFAHGGVRMYNVFTLVMESIEQGWQGLTPENKRDLLLGLAVTAWEDAPWDVHSCTILTQCAESGMEVPRPVLQVAKQGAALAAASEDIAKRLDGAIQHNDEQALRALLLRLRERSPNSLVLLKYAARLGLFTGDVDWFRDFYDGMKLPPLLVHMLDGMVHFALEEWDAAAQCHEQALQLCPLPGLFYRLGECLYRQGDAGATALFNRAAMEAPWDSTLLLRLADMREGLDRPGPLPDGQGVILLYSWNHAADLEDTLNHLLTSDLGSSKLLLLDNGSTDDTPAVAEYMRKKFAGRLRCIRLPVNVGAPAARNWLLQEPEAVKADWVTFLDDDALVPPDWLRYMGTALKAFPNAAIVGCQVSAMQGNLTVQSTDLHLSCDAMLGTGTDGASVTLKMDDFASGLCDFGYFKYIRACMSVTGCCHLLRRESIVRVGGFDIIFSPSQYDDLERDLRAVLDGQCVVFTGHLCIRHKKRTGVMVRTNHKQAVSGLGNLIKLRGLMTEQQLGEIRRADYAAVFDQLLRRVLQYGAEELG